jgi:hypothetical protein
MAHSRAKLFRRDLRLLGKHDRDFVSDGVHPATGFALQAGLIRQQMYARLANGAAQNFKQFLRNGHFALGINILN